MTIPRVPSSRATVASLLAVLVTGSALLPVFVAQTPPKADETMKQLASGTWSYLNPSFSPAGNQITYISNRSGDSEVWVMNSDGTHQTRLTYSTGEKSNPQWNSGGDRLGFLTRNTSGWGLWVMKSDGTGLRDLTICDKIGSFEWAPEGAEIAYDCEIDGRWSVRTISPAGSPTVVAGGSWDYMYPSWSPTGSEIVYASNKSGNFEIYLTRPADGTEFRLTTTHGNNIAPRLSPDGRSLLFLSDQSGRWSIWKEDLNGSEPADLLDPNAQFREPRWTPEINQNADARWGVDSRSVTFVSAPTRHGVDAFVLRLGSPIAVDERGTFVHGVVSIRVPTPLSDISQVSWRPDRLAVILVTNTKASAGIWLVRFAPAESRSGYG